MSVYWRPIRKVMPLLIAILCLVSTIFPVAAQEEIPANATTWSEETEITAELVADSQDGAAQMLAPIGLQESSQIDVEYESSATAASAEEVVESMLAEETQETSVQSLTQETEQAEPFMVQVTPEPAPSVEPAAVPAPVAAQPETAVSAEVAAADAAAAPVAENAEKAEGEEKHYFAWDRANVLVIILLLLSFVAYFTFHAQRGRELFIRRISGLSALEDAVGRATEMGRGVLYVPGIMDMDDIQTIAGVTILGHVAKKTAEYDTPLYAPMTRSFVMSVAQEIVKQSYLEKGRADAFRADRINYITDDQFGYVAGVGGLMMREKPAACFYLGTFYAESLILAETGNMVGAIQIAGTAEPSQIPFFVAACDYTLIGEELFAASAYLSKNPKEVGSLKGQDVSKIIIITIIVIGTLLMTIAQTEFGSQTVFKEMSEGFMKFLK